ncbi:hypothetical protein RKD37_004739 [Streptomyces ambofaciens]
MDAGPYLVRRDQTDVLGQTRQTVRVALVRPALGERGVQQGADGLGVGALRSLGTDAAQRGVDGEPADPPLARRRPQHGVGVQTKMGEALAVGGRHGRRDLTDHLVGVVHLQRPGGEERGQLGGVGEPLVHDVDEVVVLDGIQHLDEAGVAEQGGRACRRQHGPGSRVVSREEVDSDGAAQLLVDGPPAAEAVQTGDALLEAVTSGQLVPAVQFGRRDLDGFLARGVPLCLVAVRVPLPVVGHPVGRGLVRLCGQRLIAAVVCHVDGSCAPFRHRRSCLPIPCASADSRSARPTPNPIVPTVRRYARHTAADDGCALTPGLSVPGVRAPCRPES